MIQTTIQKICSLPIIFNVLNQKAIAKYDSSFTEQDLADYISSGHITARNLLAEGQSKMAV